MTKSEPQKEHQWLHKLVGEWTCEAEMAAQKVLTLETEGPSFAAEGKMAKYREVIEFKSDDHRTFTSHMLGDNGDWKRIMTANYRRKK